MMFSRQLLASLGLCALSGCGGISPVAGADAGMDGGVVADGGSAEAGSAMGVHGRRCGAVEVWASPLTEYIAAGEATGRRFMRGVHDLAVHDDKLFVGYGDADVNLGRVTPIAVRVFDRDDDATARSEFVTDEEQVEQFRPLDGDLWIAGVDATEDAWLGNVYRRAGGAWTKLRTVQNGVHVHDIARWRGALWAVGSGGTQAEWNARDIYGHLWRSDDRGERFQVAARHHNLRMGDARWVRLLPLAEGLLLFGYRTDSAGRASVVNARFDGTAATALPEGDPLRTSFITETLPLPEGGIARGAVNNPAGPGLVHRSYRVDATGRATVVSHLEGRAVLDIARVEGSDTLLVLSAGEGEWGRNRPDWSMRVETTRDLERFEPVVAWDTVDAVRAVAHWRGHLYLGRDDGLVLRCPLL